MASAVQKRLVTATALVEAHLAQIERHNPALNAIIALRAEAARERAHEADVALQRGDVWGPLHGVPFTVKDAFNVAGMCTTAGFPPLADYVAETDATVVRRLREAGAILLGKTNMPTMATGFSTDNPIFGRTNNPWDLTHTPGGSTGGGAAALAAGMTPLELGSDTAGSIRVPAHFSGVCGFKPSARLVPTTGHVPPPPPARIEEMRLIVAVVGPLTRTVADLALVLPILAGPDEHDYEVAPVALKVARRPSTKKLRIAYIEAGNLPVDKDTRAVLATFTRQLVDAGCTVERAEPVGFDFLVAAEVFGELWESLTGAYQPPRSDDSRAELEAEGEDDALLRGRARRVEATMRQHVETLRKRDMLIDRLEHFLQGYDAWLCPVTSTPAFTHDIVPGTPVPVGEEMVPYWHAAAYCTPFNITGNPAVSFPVGLSSGGLPIGVQAIGRRWEDMKLLAVAGTLAEVAGGFRRPAGY
jgi:amidase